MRVLSFLRTCTQEELLHTRVGPCLLLQSLCVHKSLTLLLLSPIPSGSHTPSTSFHAVPWGLMALHSICRLLFMTMLILLIYEHWRFFSLLLICSLISFFKDLKFLSYRSFTCLFRVTLRYFIWGYCEMYFTDFLSAFHLYTGRLLTFLSYSFSQLFFWKCFISCKNFLLEFLVSHIYKSKWSPN